MIFDTMDRLDHRQNTRPLEKFFIFYRSINLRLIPSPDRGLSVVTLVYRNQDILTTRKLWMIPDPDLGRGVD